MDEDKRLQQLYTRLRKQISARIPGPDVDDIVQDTVLEAWVNRAQLRDEKYYPGWTTAIANNHIVDYYRKQARCAEVFETPKEKLRRLIFEARRRNDNHSLYFAEITYAGINADEYRGLEPHQTPSAFEIEFSDLVKKLPERDRHVLTLYIRDGLTMREIGHLLGKKKRAARSVYRRAAASLSELYLRDFPEEANMGKRVRRSHLRLTAEECNYMNSFRYISRAAVFRSLLRLTQTQVADKALSALQVEVAALRAGN